MFEVGKKYKHKHMLGAFECIAVKRNFAWILRDTGGEPETYSWSDNWTEVRLKIKVEGWMNVYEDGEVYGFHRTKDDALREGNLVVKFTPIFVTGEEE